MNKETEKAIKSIGRSVANLNKQIETIKKEFPEARIYIENGDTLNIMKGQTHFDDYHSSPNYDDVIAYYRMRGLVE